MIKKQSVIALALLVLIPMGLALGGFLSNLINPEIAAGHPNYVRNYHLLNLLKIGCLFASCAVACLLWLLACFLLIRSKKQSPLWLILAVFGPFGIAVLAMLNDRAPLETDRYARFVRNMNGLVRVGYEICTFFIVWVLAYQAMVLMRLVIIRVQAITTGMSIAQVIDLQNASGGMWAFAELNEVIFLVALFYLLWPIVFSIVANVAAARSSLRAR